MKNLENIPKKEIFNVPDGYFDTLPGKIQSRITSQKPVQEPGLFFRFKLHYAIPVILFFTIGIYWFNENRISTDAESILATVQTEELVAYLGESDLSTEDLLNNVQFYSGDIEDIETEVYELNLNDEELDAAYEDLDIENIRYENP